MGGEKNQEKAFDVPALNIKDIYFEGDKLVIVASGIFKGRLCGDNDVCSDMKLKPSFLETRIILTPLTLAENHVITIFLYGFSEGSAVIKVDFVERSFERIK